jgi:hypothetical protein
MESRIAEIKYPKKQAASLIKGRKAHEKALLSYLGAPTQCRNCNNPILPKEGERPGVARVKVFCGHACAAIYNNRKYPKRKPEGICEECGKPTTKHRVWCSNLCKHKTFERRLHERAEKQGKYKGKYIVRFRQRQKQKAVQYKGGKCSICGYDRSIRAMKFHHIDPKEKEFGISAEGVTRSWAAVQLELDKCLLVCGNCHDEIHDGLIDTSLFTRSSVWSERRSVKAKVASSNLAE